MKVAFTSILANWSANTRGCRLMKLIGAPRSLLSFGFGRQMVMTSGLRAQPPAISECIIPRDIDHRMIAQHLVVGAVPLYRLAKNTPNKIRPAPATRGRVMTSPSMTVPSPAETAGMT